jgi:hypothetical protein
MMANRWLVHAALQLVDDIVHAQPLAAQELHNFLPGWISNSLSEIG